jgi:hypothetical protein
MVGKLFDFCRELDLHLHIKYPDNYSTPLALVNNVKQFYSRLQFNVTELEF